MQRPLLPPRPYSTLNLSENGLGAEKITEREEERGEKGGLVTCSRTSGFFPLTMMVEQPLDAAIHAAPTFAAMPPRPPVLFAPNWISGLCSSGEYVWMILRRDIPRIVSGA
jgi:hypothetical protein